MESYKYNDGMKSGRRRPHLYLVKNGVAHPFLSNNIPGVVVIAKEWYTKNGIWSNTEYELLLADGVKPVYLLSPLHGTWGDDLSSWEEAAQRLDLPVKVAQQIVRKTYPKTADKFDQLALFRHEQGGTPHRS